MVGTSRCDVRAACSGAIPSIANVARRFVPPATTRAGTAERAIPTIAVSRCSGEEREESSWLYQPKARRGADSRPAAPTALGCQRWIWMLPPTKVLGPFEYVVV